METKQWWEILEIIVGSTLMPNSYIIKCESCGQEYETCSLFDLPNRCPNCNSEGGNDGD